MDGTREAIRTLDGHNVEVINRGRKTGLGSALACGLRTAIGYHPSLVVTLDGDLSHDPYEIPRLLDAFSPGVLVVGSRYVEEGEWEGLGPARILVSVIANRLSGRLLGTGVKDCTSGFRCYSSDIVEAILPKLRSVGFDFQVEALHESARMGYSALEVPISFHKRRTGRSKLGLMEAVRLIRLICRVKFYQGRFTTA
jgi:dolichol-phosphate mannosyltransferase